MIEGDGTTWSTLMSEATQFRQYAEEALAWVLKAVTEKKRASLFELAHIWTQAARASEHPMPAGINYSPTDHRATL